MKPLWWAPWVIFEAVGDWCIDHATRMVFATTDWARRYPVRAEWACCLAAWVALAVGMPWPFVAAYAVATLVVAVIY